MADIEKGRKLKNIRVDEVSFVNIPANKLAFLFYKQAIEKKNRNKLEVNTMPDKHAEAILKSMETDEEDLDSIKLEEEYTKFVGEDMDEAQLEKAGKLDAKVLTAIKGAFRILNKYADSLPADLKSAVSLLGKYTTAKYPYPKPYKKKENTGKEDMEKAGKKVSKYTGTEILKAMKILEALLPEDIKKELEEAEKEIDVLEWLEKIYDGMQTSPEKKEDPKKEDTEDPKPDSATDEIKKMLEDLSARLETVEKARGTKQSIETDGDKDKELEKSEDEDEYPSIMID